MLKCVESRNQGLRIILTVYVRRAKYVIFTEHPPLYTHDTHQHNNLNKVLRKIDQFDGTSVLTEQTRCS